MKYYSACAYLYPYQYNKYWYVHVHVVAPSKIVTQPINTSASAPFGGVFTCSIEGYGYQHITWHKQSDMLPHKHKTSEITSGAIVTSTLLIPNVTQEDTGKYYCQVWAFNNVGVRSEKVDLYYSGMYSSCLC